MSLACMLCLVTICMGVRLCRLRHINLPIVDGRNMLLKCYFCFTVGYILRSINDYWIMHTSKQSFGVEIAFDVSSLSNDAIPILCMLIFHFQNFKPDEHELIIRMADHDVRSTKDDENNSQMDFFHDGMMFS